MIISLVPHLISYINDQGNVPGNDKMDNWYDTDFLHFKYFIICYIWFLWYTTTGLM